MHLNTVGLFVQENDPYAAYEPGISDRFEDVTMFLFQGLGFSSKQNAWAGPDHWKYQKSKGRYHQLICGEVTLPAYAISPGYLLVSQSNLILFL